MAVKMRKILILYGLILLIVIFAYEMTPRTDVLKKGNTLPQPQKEIIQETSPQQSKKIWDNVIVRIDDGPDKYTSEIVKTLRELGVKHAIFSLIGQNVLKYPYAVREILGAGYTIANHTFTHPRLHFRRARAYYIRNPEKWRWQIDETAKVINQVLKPVGKSYQCKIFCFPEIPRCSSATLVRIAQEEGLEPDRAWDVDSRDSLSDRKRLTLNEIVAQITRIQSKKRVVEVLIHSRKGGWSSELREIDKVLTNLSENSNNKQFASLVSHTSFIKD